MIISRNVIFDENTFPTQDWIPSLPGSSTTASTSLQMNPSPGISVTSVFVPIYVIPATNHLQPSEASSENTI